MKLATLALLLSACTFGDGEPFARVDITLHASYDVLADRDAGEGWQRLASDYQIRVDSVRLELVGLELVAQGASDSGFDPASPPPGYSLCHNGHCHHDDGRLVSYADIAAELAGGSAATVALRLPVAPLELATPVTLALACDGECALPLGGVGVVRAPVARLRISGHTRDGRTTPRVVGELAFRTDITFVGVALSTQVAVPADRSHDPDITMTASFAGSARWFDSIDFATAPVAHDGALLVSETAALGEALAATPLTITITRVVGQ